MKKLSKINESALLHSAPFVGFLLTLALFSISYLFFGWWTDSYQHMYDTAISGELTNYNPQSAHNPFPEYMPGGALILNWLGRLLPIRWIAFFLNGILFISIWILFSQALKFSVDFPKYSRILLLLFLSLLFFESVVLYHMVRITMFAGIAAVSYLLVHEEKRWISWRAIPYLILFTIALWIRSNVHLFILLFISGAFLLHKRSLKPLMPFWVLFSLFFLFYCKTVFWTDHSKDLNLYFLHNTEFKLYYTGDFKPNLQLKDALDSIKYKAIKHDILGDEVNLPPSFYDRIGIFTNQSKIGINQAKYAWMKFSNSMLENIHFIAADLFLLFFYVLLGGATLSNYRKRTFLMFVLFYGLIFCLSFIKMENRFLVPFQVLFLFTILTLHRPKFFTDQKYTLLALGFVITMFGIGSYFIKQKMDLAILQHNNFKQSFDALKGKYGNDVLIYNTGFVSMNKPFEVFYQRSYFKHFYLYNYYATQLSVTYRPYLESECQCNIGNFDNFYFNLTKNNNSVYLIDAPERIEVLKEYLSKVYHHNYDFAAQPSINNFSLKDYDVDLFVYKMTVAKPF